MNKIEFLERLEKLLADVPYTERREALNYYTEYFEDADKDEAEVIRTLGSPEEVAHNIREELQGKELAERGAETESAGADSTMQSGIGDQKERTEQDGEKKSKLEGWQVALIVIAIIITIPIWGGVVTGVFGALIGIVASFFGIILALAVVAIALFVAAVVVFGVSLTKLLVSPLAAVFAIGLSVFMFGLGMLCLIASWKCITVLIPAIWKGLVYIVNSIFHKKEGVAA